MSTSAHHIVEPADDLCSITLAGNLVATPEIRYQANPVLAIADFTVATHSRWFDKASGSFREWTSFHPVKAVGNEMEFALSKAKKGDVILMQGYLKNSKSAGKELLIATFVQIFDKGFTQEVNQFHGSGHLAGPVKLITTEQNKLLAEVEVKFNFRIRSPKNNSLQTVTIERPIHVWGNQAKFLHDKGHSGDPLIIDGKLHYLNNQEKSQLIDAKQLILLKPHS